MCLVVTPLEHDVADLCDKGIVLEILIAEEEAAVGGDFVVSLLDGDHNPVRGEEPREDNEVLGRLGFRLLLGLRLVLRRRHWRRGPGALFFVFVDRGVGAYTPLGRSRRSKCLG